jgi:16S rRNA (cytosine967-C5)-methyltransferase
MDELGERIRRKSMGYRNNSSKPTCKSSPESKHTKLQKEVLRATLMDLNIETEYFKNQPHALVLKERANVFMTDVFNKDFLKFKMPIYISCCFS